MGYIDVFAIYRTANDDEFVMVPWRSEDGRVQGGRPKTADSLEAARELVPIQRLGLVRLEPTAEDVEDLVETWI
jgi:hypothetical protein